MALSFLILKMGIIQKFHFISNIFSKDILHTFRKWARITNRIALSNAACKNDGICTAFHQFSRTKHGFFPRTTAAINKTNNLDVFFNTFKHAGFFRALL